MQMLALMGQSEDIASWATVTDSLDAKESELATTKKKLTSAQNKVK